MPVPELDGCLSVDISATPFTNTLAIRQLGLARNEAAELTVAYIALPALSATPAHQRYTCLDPFQPAGGRYRYESPTTGFTADLPVDQDALVRDYPGGWWRVAP